MLLFIDLLHFSLRMGRQAHDTYAYVIALCGSHHNTVIVPQYQLENHTDFRFLILINMMFYLTKQRWAEINHYW